MSKVEKTPELITEHIFEIQHEASGKFLDLKGAIADYIKESGVFKDWQIDPNGIKFFNANVSIIKEKESIVGYNLIQFSTKNPPTKNFFEDNVEKFIKTLIKNKIYTIQKI